MKLFHVSQKIFRPHEVIGPLARNYYSDPARQPPDAVIAQEALDAGRPRGVCSRLSAHFAFDIPELCRAYWSGEETRARSRSDAGSPYLLLPHYYEIQMASAVKAPMAVAEWVFQLLDHHADPTPPIAEYWAPRREWRVWEYLDRDITIVGEMVPPTDPTGLALFLHAEDRKAVKAEWPLPA